MVRDLIWSGGVRRVLFIWLPYWATQRLVLQARRTKRAVLPTPLVLLEAGQGGMRISALDADACAHGLYCGQLWADARALVPKAQAMARDRIGEAGALARLARWCGRWSPDVAVAPGGEGVMLDSAGVAHLFGGEAGLLRDALGRVRAFGLTAQAALADTAGAAQALAMSHPEAGGPHGVIAPVGAGFAPLLDLPIEALRLEAGLPAKLRALGLRRIADLTRQSRASLARRFGSQLLQCLDQAAGRMGQSLDPLPLARQGSVQRRFAEPMQTLEGLKAVAAHLAHGVAALLARENAGARRLVLRLYRVDGDVLQFAIGAARPENDPGRLARLFAERLDRAAARLDLGFGVDHVQMRIVSAQPLEAQAQALDPAMAEAGALARQLAALSDQLAARFGEAAVQHLAPRDSHWPEQAQGRCPRDDMPAPFDAQLGVYRPLLLLNPPEPIEAVAEVPDSPPRLFRWRRIAHGVLRAEGPERLDAEWWDKQKPPRDYYRVETVGGQRLWLFREGLYGVGESPPRWFMHGAFA